MGQISGLKACSVRIEILGFEMLQTVASSARGQSSLSGSTSTTQDWPDATLIRYLKADIATKLLVSECVEGVEVAQADVPGRNLPGALRACLFMRLRALSLRAARSAIVASVSRSIAEHATGGAYFSAFAARTWRELRAGLVAVWAHDFGQVEAPTGAVRLDYSWADEGVVNRSSPGSGFPGAMYRFAGDA